MGYMTIQLWCAVKDGDASEIKTLLLDPEHDALAKDGSGWTPLMYGASYGHASCVSLLLPVSDPLTKDGCGWTALMHAACGGYAPCLQLLLPLSDPLACDKNGWTALMYAAGGVHEACLRLLLPVSDLFACDGNKRTASKIASDKGHVHIVESIDAYILAQQEKTALHSAIAAGAPQKRSSLRV